MSSIALVRAYQQSFESHPYGTLALTNGVLNAAGDAVAQVVEKMTFLQDDDHRRPRYDIPRTLRFFTFGVGMGPIIGRWNFFLEKHFPLRFRGSSSGAPRVSIPALTKRVAADQIVMAPIGLALFISSMGMMEGRDAPHIRGKFKDMYTPALITNWQVWPVVQFINFRYMPLPYRVPFQSTVGVAWTLYLSILNSKEDQKQDHHDALRKTLQ
ncbi:hypothetical protein CERSUDRAFT_90289 [Gelatoporia subvermispora B]|uniref:Protein sym1 n=1 Tax=Ceriporiopsis subvermispora (strain B) TaxID=914234 RepID=M2RS25_CERS8|nr:hypothetical protein CERSUDRAFT_90289 [Gelatoporia subvermispora B]